MLNQALGGRSAFGSEPWATFISIPPLAGMHVKHQIRITPEPFFIVTN